MTYTPRIDNKEITPSRKPLPKVTTFFSRFENKKWVDLGLGKFFEQNDIKFSDSRSIPKHIKQLLKDSGTISVEMFGKIVKNNTHVTAYELKHILTILDIECTITFKFKNDDNSTVNHTFN